jgi:hypothetical protein
MKVTYELQSDGRAVHSLVGKADTAEELNALRKTFWSKITLPWGGSTVVSAWLGNSFYGRNYRQSLGQAIHRENRSDFEISLESFRRLRR